MSRPIALLLPDIAAIDQLAPEQLAPTLAQLAALQARIAARLATTGPPFPPLPAEDDLLESTRWRNSPAARAAGSGTTATRCRASASRTARARGSSGPAARSSPGSPMVAKRLASR